MQCGRGSQEVCLFWVTVAEKYGVSVAYADIRGSIKANEKAIIISYRRLHSNENTFLNIIVLLILILILHR